jgi:hypothetical protein
MVKDVYKSYFQKSSVFLYPLLNIPKNYGVVNKRPKKTYIASKNTFKPEDLKLFAVYENSDDSNWKIYFERVLLKNKNVEGYFTNGDEIIVLFSLDNFREDLEHFLNGKYSKFSNEARKAISSYYGVQTPEWAYLESFLYPSKYFKDYAKILDVDEEALREVGELCNKYDLEKETLNLEIPEQLISKTYDKQNNVGL